MESKYDVVLLLGGTGSRMPNKPENKHLVKVNGKTMVEHAKDKIDALEDIVDIENKYAIVSTHGVDKIMPILGEGWTYKYQSNPTGLIDAAKIANPKNPFLLYLGDQFYQEHLGRLVAGFNESGKVGRIWLKHSDQARYHTTMFPRENLMFKFREKPNVKEGYVVTGLYMFQPGIFKYSNNLPRNEKGENNLADVLTKVMSETGFGGIDSKIMKGYWSDVGTPEKLQQANRYARGTPTYKVIPP